MSKTSVNEMLEGWACHVTHRYRSYEPEDLANDSTVYGVDEFLERATYVKTTPGFAKAEAVLRLRWIEGRPFEALSRSDQLLYRRFRRSLYRRLVASPFRLSTPYAVISGREVAEQAAAQASAYVEARHRGVRVVG